MHAQFAACSGCTPHPTYTNISRTCVVGDTLSRATNAELRSAQLPPLQMAQPHEPGPIEGCLLAARAGALKLAGWLSRGCVGLVLLVVAAGPVWLGLGAACAAGTWACPGAADDDAVLAIAVGCLATGSVLVGACVWCAPRCAAASLTAMRWADAKLVAAGKDAPPPQYVQLPADALGGEAV